jgi:hypothetical protein
MRFDFESNIDRQIGNLGDLATKRNMTRVKKALVREVAKGGERAGKLSLRAIGLKTRSSLYKSLKGQPGKRDKTTAAIYPRGSGSFLKGLMLQTGTVRQARKGDYMTFNVGGQWVRKNMVVQKATPWADAIGVYLQSSKATHDMEARLEKEIKKIIDRQARA